MNRNPTHIISNDKLRLVYMEVWELQEKYSQIMDGWKLSSEYYMMSKLGLFLAHTDTELQFRQWETANKEKRMEIMENSIFMIRGMISQITLELELEKSKIISFSKRSLRQKRDRYVDMLAVYRHAQAVIERL